MFHSTFHTTMLALAVGAAAGCTATSDAAGETSAEVAQNSGAGFQCFNKLDIQVVSCVGSVAVLPIDIDIKDIRALNDNELNVLSDDLNNVSILDGGILNNDKILNDLQVTVLQDFLHKFLINVSGNRIDVCTAVLGLPLCK